MIDKKTLTHPKDKTYTGIIRVFAYIFWGLIAIGFIFGIYGIIKSHKFSVLLMIPAIVLYIFACGWLAEQFFRAMLFGNAVKLYKSQYPEIYSMIELQCNEAGIKTIPEVIVVNGNGFIAAMAFRFVTSTNKYIILTSSLVDLYLQRGRMQELGFVTGHEIGHIAAGHIGVKRNLLLFPGKLVFFPFLYLAFKRAQEMTADRYGAVLCAKPEAAEKALMALASGSVSLSDYTNAASFVQQENEMSGFFAWLIKIYSAYPRLTIRVKEIMSFSAGYKPMPTAAPAAIVPPPAMPAV